MNSQLSYCILNWCYGNKNLVKRLQRLCYKFVELIHQLILSTIQPAELCQMEVTLSLAHRGSLEPDHILYGLFSGSSDTRQVSLRSRHPFVPAAQNSLPDMTSALLNGQITNGERSTVKMLSDSVFSCPGPVPGLLG